MTTSVTRRLAGAILLVTTALVLLAQIGLAATFDYPNITSQTPEVILDRYARAGALIRLSWFGFAVGTLLMTAVALTFHQLARNERAPWLCVGTAFGVLAGIAYYMGISRWVHIFARLSQQYVAPSTTAAQKETISIAFQGFDTFFGQGMGETLAPITHGLWLFLLGSAMLSSPAFSRRTAWFQVGSGVLIACRPLEYVGLAWGGEVGDAAVALWTLLSMALAVRMLIGREPSVPPGATRAENPLGLGPQSDLNHSLRSNRP